MKVLQTVEYHMQYHRTNSKKHTIKTCLFVLAGFNARFGNRELDSIKSEEILSFLVSLTKDNK